MQTAVLLAMLVGLPIAAQPEERREVEQIIVEVPDGGYLGVRIRDVHAEDVERLGLPEERGVYVEDVEAGSPAAGGGLREGDVILEYAGQPVFSVRQFRRWVSDTPPGREVAVGIWRDGGRREISIRVGRRESAWSGPGPERREFRFRIPQVPFDLEPSPWGPDIEHWRVPAPREQRPRLGISAVPVTRQLAENLDLPQEGGVFVLEVEADSPAAKAGLQAGDVILKANGRTVRTVESLARQLEGDAVKLTFWRRGETKEVEVQLEVPETGGRGRMRL
ncbi:MAG: hypothetical protein Kow00109_29090 [Acidobacteriota bacterium]